MSNKQNKAIQYMKILEEYDQGDSLYDTTVYADVPPQAVSDLPSIGASYSLDLSTNVKVPGNNAAANTPAAATTTNNNNSDNNQGRNPVWYRALVNDAWGVVEKSIQTSNIVLSEAWLTVEALGTGDNMKNQTQQQGGSSTNVVLPQSKVTSTAVVPAAARIPPVVPQSNFHIPELRQPMEGGYDHRAAKRLEPEENVSIKKEKKELAAKRRAARAKQKGGPKKNEMTHQRTEPGPKAKEISRAPLGVRHEPGPKAKEMSRAPLGVRHEPGPKAKEVRRAPLGVRHDPPGTAARGFNDDATRARSRRRRFNRTVPQPNHQGTMTVVDIPHQQPRSIVRYDLEEISSKPWDIKIPDCACAGPAKEANMSHVPLRPCDIPRGSEIRKQKEAVFPGVAGEFISNALKPFGL